MGFESEVKAVVFTNPTKPDSQAHDHIAFIQQLINSTLASDQIHICISHFSHEPTADVLVSRAANDCGVTVRIILRSDNRAIKNYFALKDRESKVEITEAKGCYGKSIHMKLFLFSQTKLDGKTIQHVAVVGSANLTSGDRGKHQNTIAVVDAQFYQGLIDHWSRMRERAHEDNRAPEVAGIDLYSTSSRIKAYLFPRSVDPVVNIINNLKGIPHTENGAKPYMRIAMARWTRARHEILVAIEGRVTDGCVVDLVLRVEDPITNGDDGTYKQHIDELLELKSRHHDQVFIYTGNIATHADTQNVHSKYLLIEGYYGEGVSWETNVWSGSENWTDPAVHNNDEIMVKFRDEDLYQHFVENHKMLKSVCTELELHDS